MKLKINGIEREVQIVQAPQGAFCCLDELAYPAFPLFVGLCKAITKEETSYGDILMFPIFDGNFGYASISVDDVKNELILQDLEQFITNYAINYEYRPLKDVVHDIMYNFYTHKTPISEATRAYVKRVMDGTITDFPKTK